MSNSIETPKPTISSANTSYVHFECDLAGGILFLSEGWHSIFGLSIEAALGTKIYGYFIEPHQMVVESSLRSIVARQGIEYEVAAQVLGKSESKIQSLVYLRGRLNPAGLPLSITGVIVATDVEMAVYRHIANVIHEVNNNLLVISGSASRIKKNIDKLGATIDLEGTKVTLTKIEEQSQKINLALMGLRSNSDPNK